jgi:hypothetical protein
VPYGSNNQLALDTTSARPTLFAPGKHEFAFGVSFGTNQTVSYTLQPDNSPRTTVSATKTSPQCTAPQVECLSACQNTLRSGCTVTPTFSNCMDFCREFSDLSSQLDCAPAYTAFNQCVSTTAAGPDNWFCGDGYPYEAVDCQDELNDLFSCLGF